MAIENGNERLEHFRLRQPACDRFQRWPVQTQIRLAIRKATSGAVELPTPFFWYDPPWHLLTLEQASGLANEMAASGIVVAALHRDLSANDDSAASEFSPRMAPHRCDRGGWIYRDCQSVSIIDLRMMPPRDANGCFAYHPRQLVRWRNLSDGEVSEMEDQSDAMTFPPDWQTLDDMSAKVMQLRTLSDAAIFVSFDALAIDTLLPAAIAANVDGLIVTVEGDPVQAILRAREQMQRSQRAHRPELWIATKQRLSAEDAVKCFALGATGLGVDAICNDYLWNGSRAELSVEKWTRQVRGFARSCGAEALGDLRPAHLLPV